MNFEARVIRNLPTELGATITHGELFRRMSIKTGLNQALISLKKKGKLTFELDADGRFNPATIITIIDTEAEAVLKRQRERNDRAASVSIDVINAAAGGYIDGSVVQTIIGEIDPDFD